MNGEKPRDLKKKKTPDSANDWFAGTEHCKEQKELHCLYYRVQRVGHDRQALQEAEIVVEIDETVLKRARWAGM